MAAVPQGELEVAARSVDEGLALPYDITRPACGFELGERVCTSLETHTVEGLRQLARRHGSGPEAVYLAAFAALVLRYSGSDRLDLWHDRADGDLLDHELVCAAHTRFVDLIEPRAIHPWRPGEDSEIQVLVVDPGHPRPRQIFATRHVRLGLVLPATEPLSGDRPPAEQSAPRLLYDASLFHEQTITRAEGHLRSLLQAMLEDPEQDIDAPALLAPQERLQLLEGFNRTAGSFHIEHPVVQLEVRGQRTPDRVAYGYGERQTTFGELEALTHGLATALLQRGLRRGEAVGVRLQRSERNAVALLAIWRAGGVYVPIDPGYPREHIAHIVEDNSLRLVICDPEEAVALQGLGLEPVAPQARGGAEVALPPPPEAGRPAVVMYTSGSTGRPKGVVHSHANLLNRFTWLLERYPIASDEVLLQRTNVNFIPSLWEMVGGVMAGCRTLVVDDRTARDPAGLAALVERQGATRLGLVPSLLTAMLESVPELGRKLASLRLVNIAGEPLSSQLAETLLRQLPGLRLVNDYGSTETNGVLSCDDSDPFGHRRLVPAGRPIGNVRAYVLDERRRPVPIGVKAGLYIASDYLPRGYVNLEAASRERFLQQEFGNERQERLYRSGDVARYLDDGRIEVLGRSDNVVKVRGIRVEIEGVEVQLAGHPRVQECAVTALEDEQGNKRLVAYLVADPGQPPSVTELRTFLAERLPEYMLPSRYLRLATLPRTPNGKLARAALGAVAAEAEPLPFGAPAEGATAGGAGAAAGTTDYLRDVMEVLARTLGMPLEADAAKIAFSVLGLDSLSAVTFMERLGQRLGRTLDVTLLFAHPSPAALVARLEQEQQRPIPKEAEAGPLPGSAARSGQAMDIAVVGLSCRFPDAPDQRQYWENLAAGRDSVSEIPAERWAWQDYYDPRPGVPNKSISKWGAFLRDIDKFDPVFFQVSPREAQLMDPQQRLLLEECWKAVEDAGYNEQSIDGLPVGVYIGARPGDYHERIAAAGHAPDARSLLGNDSAILAARIAYYLNLHGPAMTMDTACSSSLVSCYLACRALLEGECEAALVGGVSLVTTPTIYVVNSNAGMLSPEGRCKTFDDSADGFVQGEGVGVMMLKRMDRALADGDRIYAVIRAGGINQDGKSNGITAPSGASQAALVREVYRRYGIDSASIQYIEAHGTGTRLGDPIEVDALHRAYADANLPVGSRAIGSVKTNIGHLIAAAGMASLFKVILSMQARRLPPSLHFHTPNRHIDFASIPFRVNTEDRAWEVAEGAVRRAAISSFGFSGTNCHLVCDEAPPQPPRHHPQRPYVLLPLAAKSDQALDRRLAELAAWCGSATELDLQDVAYSLCRRLSAHSRRAALVVADVTELQALAQRVAEGGEHPGYFRQGAKGASLRGAGAFTRFATGLMAELEWRASADAMREGLQALAQLYVLGLDLSWQGLYPAERHNLLSLPCYPFARESYWIEAVAGQAPTALPAGTQGREPRSFLESIESGPRRHLYAVGFDGSEYVLDQHRIQGQPVLPGAAQLEILARVVAQAGRGAPHHLRDLTWTAPYRYGPEAGPLSLEVRHLDREVSDFELHSAGGNDPRQRLAHAKGKIVWGQADSRLGRKLDLQGLAARCPEQVAVADYYARFRRQGIAYGPRFRCIQAYRKGEREALAWVASDRSYRQELEQHPFLPEDMDAVWQACAGLVPEQEGQPPLPFAIGEIQWRGLPDNCLVYVRCLEAAEQAARGIYRFQLLVTDRHHRLVLHIKDFVLRRATGGSLSALPGGPRREAPARIHAYAQAWRPATMAEPQALRGPVLAIAASAAGTALLAAARATPALAGLSWLQVAAVGVNTDAADAQGPQAQEALPAMRMEREEDYSALVERLQGSDAWPAGILLALDPPALHGAEQLPAALDGSLYPLLWLSKALLRVRPTAPVRLLVVRPPRVPQADMDPYPALGAVARSLALENPRLRCTVLDIEAVSEAGPPAHAEGLTGARLATELALAGAQAQVAYRDGQRLERLVEAVDLAAGAHRSLRREGVYLVTGGLGGIGLELARYLAERYRARLVLVGRRPANGAAAPLPAGLGTATEAVYLRADVGRSEQVARLMDQVGKRFGALHGIFHCAGVTRDALLINKTPQQVQEVLAAKVQGALNLLQGSAALAPELLVLFSSISAITGTPGQTDYAYANAFLDELARRRGQGSPRLVSVGWSLWEAGGMRPPAAVVRQLAAQAGMAPLPVAEALAALEAVLDSDRPQVLVAYGSGPRLDAFVGAATEQPHSRGQ